MQFLSILSKILIACGIVVWIAYQWHSRKPIRDGDLQRVNRIHIVMACVMVVSLVAGFLIRVLIMPWVWWLG